MFKTIEELIEEGRRWVESPSYYNGLDVAFESFAERVEFYKRYRWDIEKSEKPSEGMKLLEIEQPEIYKMWKNCTYQFYNDWLFDYFFGDVIE